MFMVYFFTLLIGSVYITDLILNKQKLQKLNVFIIIFLFINIIATIFAGNKYTALWGYYSRFNGGLFSIFSFYIIYFVARNKLDKHDLYSLFHFILLGTIPVSFFGIIQHCSGVARAYSSLGQPNWLAQYFAILLPLIFYKLFTEKFELWFVVYIAGFFCLWYAYSLSGVLAFTTGILAGIYILKQQKYLNNKKLGFILGATLLIAIINPGIFGNKIADVFKDAQKVTLAKKAQAAEQLSDPGFIRLGLWKGTWDLISASPENLIIGVGPENFAYEFQEYRPEVLNYSSEWDFVFNKAHNYYLELWAEVGFLGLLSFILIIFKFFKTASPEYKPAMIGFLVSNIFGWPVVCTSLLFWMILCSEK